MTDRDRLADLIDRYFGVDAAYFDVDKYELADHLLSNGVIVPPCKVGETLYFLYDRTYAISPDLTLRIYKTNDWYFDIDQKGISILPRNIHSYRGKYHYCLGETVFLTREEAE